VGWAWAIDGPLKWTKQVASHFGGTRSSFRLILSSHLQANPKNGYLFERRSEQIVLAATDPTDHQGVPGEGRIT
jgi:hypothetical protein